MFKCVVLLKGSHLEIVPGTKGSIKGLTCSAIQNSLARLLRFQIDWDTVTRITYSTDYFQRLTLESWFTNLKEMPLNRSQQLQSFK